MAEPWENPNSDTSYWDVTSGDYSSQAERDEGGQTLDEPWEYQNDDYGYTKADESQMTGYSEARIADVKRIQTALQRASYNPGSIDGLWGPKTCSAMLAFQKAKFGTAKAGWLDMQTWAALGFDTSSQKKFEDLYGMSCGGAPPEGWTGAGSGTNVAVSTSDIQKMQYAMGVLTTGKLDKATCEAAYKKQKALGITGTKLMPKLFETLGFTTSQAQKLSTQLAVGCTAYYTTSGSSTTNNTTKTCPTGYSLVNGQCVQKTSPTPSPTCNPGYKVVNGQCVKDEQQAGFGWWVLGGMLVVGVIGWAAQKAKR